MMNNERPYIFYRGRKYELTDEQIKFFGIEVDKRYTSLWKEVPMDTKVKLICPECGNSFYREKVKLDELAIEHTYCARCDKQLVFSQDV